MYTLITHVIDFLFCLCALITMTCQCRLCLKTALLSSVVAGNLHVYTNHPCHRFAFLSVCANYYHLSMRTLLGECSAVKCCGMCTYMYTLITHAIVFPFLYVRMCVCVKRSLSDYDLEINQKCGYLEPFLFQIRWAHCTACWRWTPSTVPTMWPTHCSGQQRCSLSTGPAILTFTRDSPLPSGMVWPISLTGNILLGEGFCPQKEEKGLDIIFFCIM